MELSTDWEAINAEWESSGQSQEDFCRNKDILFSTFEYRRGKYLKSRKKSEPSMFTSVRLTQPSSVRRGSELTLQLPNGIRLGIPMEYSSTQLKLVLTMLGVMPC